MTSTADVVAAGLGAWLEERFSGSVALVGTPGTNTGGFDSAIYFVQYSGATLPSEWQQPLVVRVKPRREAIDVARVEAARHEWLAEIGYPVPRILEVLEPDVLGPLPAQVMVRAPGRMLFDAVKHQPWTTRRRLHQLARLQVDLHRLPVEGFPHTGDLVDRRLALPRQLAEELHDPALSDALEQTERLVPRLRSAPASVCHGDFHPLNVLVDGPSASVIDWSDAGIGDRHGDVARTILLFELASIAATNRVERSVLVAAGPIVSKRYRRAYERLLPLEAERVALWRPTHLIHAWAQTLGAHAGRFDHDGGLAARLPDGLVDGLQRRFAAAIAAV